MTRIWRQRLSKMVIHFFRVGTKNWDCLGLARFIFPSRQNLEVDSCLSDTYYSLDGTSLVSFSLVNSNKKKNGIYTIKKSLLWVWFLVVIITFSKFSAILWLPDLWWEEIRIIYNELIHEYHSLNGK